MFKEPRHLVVWEQVMCLECGLAYSKPSAGGTTDTNPGCPSCGYVGWIPRRRPAEREAAHERARKAL